MSTILPPYPNPVTDIEMYLNCLATGQGEFPLYPNPVTDVEKYLAYLCETGYTARGYYYNGAFYADVQHTVELPEITSKLYYDIQSGTLYIYDGTQYSLAGGGIPAEEKGAPNGVATLDENGKVPHSQLDISLNTFAFRGFISSAEPSGELKENELWFQSETMPTTFPIQVKRYDGEAWSAETESYTPTSLDMWANLADNHGYYWFGNNWNIIDVNVEYDNITIGVNALGQLEIKSAYKLPAVTTSDEGKFLRVNASGAWVAESVPTYTGGSY